ncbi:MAG: transporter [Acidobacteriota bacterium]
MRDRTGFVIAAAAAVLAVAGPARAQQRPLVTEDPETIGAGRVLLESGLDYARDILFPLSGLRGNLLAVPTVGVSVGLSSIAEIQIDGGLYRRLAITDRRDAPFASRLDLDGDRATSVDDVVLATKVRLLGEQASRPAIGLRFATRLPNSSNESGLGRDTTDFTAALLLAKTVQSIRVVGNAGLSIQGDPTEAARQDDLFVYGLSVARAVTNAAEFVGEINGRYNHAQGVTPGAENQATMRLGGRYTRGSVRVDAAVLLGMTSRDPGFGVTAGVTWVFDAFQIP